MVYRSELHPLPCAKVLVDKLLFGLLRGDLCCMGPLINNARSVEGRQGLL